MNSLTQHQLWKNSVGNATHTPNVTPGEVCLMFSQATSEWPPRQTRLSCFSSAPNHCHQADSCGPLTQYACSAVKVTPARNSVPKLVWVKVLHTRLVWFALQCGWHVPLGVLEQLYVPLTLRFTSIHTALILPDRCVDLLARACHPMSGSTVTSIQ